MQYDRVITLCAAGTRKAQKWPEQTTTITNFYERLRNPARSTETTEEYAALDKTHRDELKDVGGYVFGQLAGGRRKVGTVLSRDAITLDADNIRAGGTDDILQRLSGLGCNYCVYSTRSHTPAKPRLRIVLPLDKSCTADEYEPAARRIAYIIDPTMQIYDPTTFEPSRLMYWASCCADGEYVYHYADLPLLSAEGLLAQYNDWHNWAEWPQVPGSKEKNLNAAKRQQDPETKCGIVGAWCKVHSISDVIDTVLEGIYTPTTQPDRLTYSAGSTTGGALVYDDKFIYSHHATDPAGGKLCNSFDLCRIHLFGAQDDDALPGTPTGKLPSYKAMCNFARNDKKVGDLLNLDRYEQANADVAQMMSAQAEQPDTHKPDVAWMKKLQKAADSERYEHSIYNAYTMLNGDPKLKEHIRLNTFTGRIEGICPLPWAGRREGTGTFEWTDTDDAGLRDTLERLLKYHSADTVNDALVQVATEHAYNPVQDYLNSLVWDGVPRLDTMYHDYFGDTDNAYTRAVSRKSMVAAVSRAMTPGCKYDEMVVICGPQGTYKSTFVALLGGNWASTLMVSFDDPKAVAEVMQSNWIVEVPELSGMSRADINNVKQMITQTCDEYRAAYARRPEKHPRKCILIGTTNDSDYLRDATGNRRYWPIDCDINPACNVLTDLTTGVVGQLWAEAVMYWRMGEPLVLGAEEEKEAESRRSGHTVRDDYEGVIAEYLDKPVPKDWLKMDATQRQMFLNGQWKGDDSELVHRDRVCVLEVLCECFGYRVGWEIKPQKSRAIAKIIDQQPKWKKATTQKFGADYGTQKAWRYTG